MPKCLQFTFLSEGQKNDFLYDGKTLKMTVHKRITSKQKYSFPYLFNYICRNHREPDTRKLLNVIGRLGKIFSEK